MNDSIKTILSTAYFIGGSPCSGKSTIAEIIANEFDLEYYKIDDYQGKHMEESDPYEHPTMYKYTQMKWDEIWMRPVDLQVKEEIEFYRERFDMIIRDIEELNSNNPIIMEGAALLPELVHKIGVNKNHVIYMVPIKEFQIKYYSQREFINFILSECRNPEKAFENWMERDYRFGKRVADEAKDIGYKIINVDGTKSIEENLEIVTNHFKLK